MNRLILLTVFLHGTAFADLTYVPKWHMLNDQACYDLDDAKTLVSLDSKLVLCTEEELQYPSLQKDEATAYELQGKELDASQQMVTLWQTHAQTLTSSLEQCETAKATAQNHTGSDFGWLVAGALVLVGLGIGGGLYLSKH